MHYRVCLSPGLAHCQPAAIRQIIDHVEEFGEVRKSQRCPGEEGRRWPPSAGVFERKPTEEDPPEADRSRRDCTVLHIRRLRR